MGQAAEYKEVCQMLEESRSRSFLYLVIPVLLFIAAGCSSTSMTRSWRYPETGPLEFDSVMAVVLVQDPLLRRLAENALVRQIVAAEAVASYRSVPDEDLGDEAKVRERIAASGVDGVVVMRLVYDENEVAYNAGTYPGPYYSIWDTTAGPTPLPTSPATCRRTDWSGSRRTSTTSRRKSSSGPG